ncbi:MAG: hypothetical protein WAP37_08020, partial [Solirubrobacterales bacterium]
MGAALAAIPFFFAELIAGRLVPMRLIGATVLGALVMAPALLLFAYVSVRTRINRVEAARTSPSVAERRRAIENGLRIPIFGSCVYAIAWSVGVPLDLLLTGLFTTVTTSDFVVMYLGVLAVAPVLMSVAVVILEDQMRPLLHTMQQELPDSERGREFGVRRFSMSMRVSAVLAA